MHAKSANKSQTWWLPYQVQGCDNTTVICSRLRDRTAINSSTSVSHLRAQLQSLVQLFSGNFQGAVFHRLLSSGTDGQTLHDRRKFFLGCHHSDIPSVRNFRGMPVIGLHLRGPTFISSESAYVAKGRHNYSGCLSMESSRALLVIIRHLWVVMTTTSTTGVSHFVTTTALAPLSWRIPEDATQWLCPSDVPLRARRPP